MRKKMFLLALVIIIVTSFSLSGQEDQDKQVYYICFDNSWSIKRYDFYQRLIGYVISHLKREGAFEDIQMKYIAFGTRWTSKMKIIDDYTEFAGYIIKNKKFATTDFVRLMEILDKIEDEGTIIVISDGEHDNANDPPFTRVTVTELKQMLEVIDKMKGKNLPVHAIHILKEHSQVKQPRSIRYYYSQLSESSAFPIGVEANVTGGNIIAALTRDFMKRLASDKDNYHFCTGNKDAVKAFMGIFGIPLPFECDPNVFTGRIPLKINFQDVDSNTKEWFWQKLENQRFCIEGAQRQFQKNPNSNDFQLTIQYISNDAYIAKLDYETIWKNRKISDNNHMDQFIERVIDSVQTKITNEFANDPRYTVPKCVTSLKFLDEKLYAFIMENNFSMHIKRCSTESWEKADVSFFDEDKRAYILVPLVIADGLFITVPGDDKNLHQGLNIPLTNRVFNSWDSPELTVSPGDIHYPTITYNFSGFLSTYSGTILFFSADTKRYYGMVGEAARQSQIELFSGRRYKIYFVPEEIETHNIKSTIKTLNDTVDIKNTLDNRLEPTRVDVAFTDWEECLGKFKNAGPADSTGVSPKDIITRQIAASNGYFLILQHLGEIMDDEEKKQVFRELLEHTIEIYAGRESPFESMDLLLAKIPGFSKWLKEKYLGLGNRGKMTTIIQVLSNPISSLTQLKHWLDGNPQLVIKELQKYFKELED